MKSKHVLKFRSIFNDMAFILLLLFFIFVRSSNYCPWDFGEKTISSLESVITDDLFINLSVGEAIRVPCPENAITFQGISKVYPKLIISSGCKLVFLPNGIIQFAISLPIFLYKRLLLKFLFTPDSNFST